MVVRRLECSSCGIAVEGHFDTGPIARLAGEQLSFVEAFLRARGKNKDVDEELGTSYPTGVERLNEVLSTMGFEPQDETREAERRQKILDDLAAGRLDAAEAAELLRTPGPTDG